MEKRSLKEKAEEKEVERKKYKIRKRDKKEKITQGRK
jgi:hypothetical protein